MRLHASDGRELWLAYCMNVHAGTVDAQERALAETVAPLRERLGVRGPFGVGLRFHEDGLALLRDDARRRDAFVDALRRHGLVPFTANGFVVGAFHGRSLKDEVYAPSWRSDRRLRYTVDLAAVMADLVRRAGGPDAISLSTSPLAWRRWGDEGRERSEGADRLVEAVRALAALEERTGVCVRLGLEPEPGCVLDTSEDAARFLERVRNQGGEAGARHLGACYDVCHQAVMHEDVREGLDAFAAHGVPVVKAQLTCALEVPDPRDDRQRETLAAFDEEVYLHQVGGRDAEGAFRLVDDLGPALAEEGPLDPASSWRVHFHVPVHRRDLAGGLRATRPALDALLAVVATSPVTPHLEIETYTFDVLPDIERRAGSGADLVASLEREMRSVLEGLACHGVHPAESCS